MHVCTHSVHAAGASHPILCRKGRAVSKGVRTSQPPALRCSLIVLQARSLPRLMQAYARFGVRAIRSQTPNHGRRWFVEIACLQWRLIGLPRLMRAASFPSSGQLSGRWIMCHGRLLALDGMREPPRSDQRFAGRPVARFACMHSFLTYAQLSKSARNFWNASLRRDADGTQTAAGLRACAAFSVNRRFLGSCATQNGRNDEDKIWTLGPKAALEPHACQKVTQQL